jgi:hypothetical protein
MTPDASTEDIYEERIARYLDLAEGAQEAAERASSDTLKETYAALAHQWAELAKMAQRTIDLARNISRSARAADDRRDVQNRRMH